MGPRFRAAGLPAAALRPPAPGGRSPIRTGGPA